MEYMPIPKKYYDMIEELVRISSETSGTKPETTRDWEIVVKIYELWKTFFPEQYTSFVKGASLYREEHLFNKGIKKEGQSLIQHVLEIPEQLDKMLIKVYPGWKWDKDNTKKFVRILPEFNVSNE